MDCSSPARSAALAMPVVHPPIVAVPRPSQVNTELGDARTGVNAERRSGGSRIGPLPTTAHAGRLVSERGFRTEKESLGLAEVIRLRLIYLSSDLMRWAPCVSLNQTSGVPKGDQVQ